MNTMNRRGIDISLNLHFKKKKKMKSKIQIICERKANYLIYSGLTGIILLLYRIVIFIAMNRLFFFCCKI